MAANDVLSAISFRPLIGLADWGELTVAWTIRASLLAYAFALLCLILYPSAKREPQHQRMIRSTWTLAWLMYVLHVLAAFHFVHHWEHQRAVEHTAEKSLQIVGIAFGGGIYFNHLLTLIWTVDVLWFWLRPASYESRSRWIAGTFHGYILFLAINGAIIFETGPARWFGIPILLALAVLVLSRPRKPTTHAIK